ncbi:MAG: general secretion pathway protein GspB, partial [Thermodesulfobacteriota bacterium]|nr:general secretion pathway protein GspB [Thermodesulfobacteriota bacterium]
KVLTKGEYNMSYILEALKKSERERQRENIPDLQADHSLPPVRRDERKRPAWRLPLILILILLCSGGLFWWQQSDDQDPQLAEKAPQVIPTLPVPSSSATQDPDVSANPPESAELSVKIKEQISWEVHQAVGLVSENVSPFPVAVSEENPAPLEETAPRLVPGQENAAPPLMEDLPFVVRAGIPDLTFAGHVYADDAQKRMIIINNRIVREGDLITNGLSLEQISPNGVVLLYETTVFRVDLF